MFTMKNNLIVIVILIVLALFESTTSNLFDRLRDRCSSKSTCHECIQTTTCAWCYHDNYPRSEPRCFNSTHSGVEINSKCPEEFTFYPTNIIAKLMDYELSGSSSSSDDNATVNVDVTSIRPQRIKIKLRIDEPQYVEFTISQTEVHGNRFPSIEIKDSAPSSINIIYRSSCVTGDTQRIRNKCDGLKIGDLVTFTAEIIATSCPSNEKEWEDNFQIYPVDIPQSLVVDIEMICDCPCERESAVTYEVASPKCYGHGTYKCGICECEDTYFGSRCECSTMDSYVIDDTDSACKPSGNSMIECSGRGSCICGHCECEERENNEEIISGQYCECDNYSCERYNGQLCSGPDHGICQCGRCYCKPDWAGLACDLPI